MNVRKKNRNKNNPQPESGSYIGTTVKDIYKKTKDRIDKVLRELILKWFKKRSRKNSHG